MNVNDLLAIIAERLPHLEAEVKNIPHDLHEELDRVELFVDRDDTHQFGYEPDIDYYEVDDNDDGEVTRLIITFAPSNAFVVLPNVEDEEYPPLGAQN